MSSRILSSFDHLLATAEASTTSNRIEAIDWTGGTCQRRKTDSAPEGVVTRRSKRTTCTKSSYYFGDLPEFQGLTQHPDADYEADGDLEEYDESIDPEHWVNEAQQIYNNDRGDQGALPYHSCPRYEPVDLPKDAETVLSTLHDQVECPFNFFRRREGRQNCNQNFPSGDELSALVIVHTIEEHSREETGIPCPHGTCGVRWPTYAIAWVMCGSNGRPREDPRRSSRGIGCAFHRRATVARIIDDLAETPMPDVLEESITPCPYQYQGDICSRPVVPRWSLSHPTRDLFLIDCCQKSDGSPRHEASTSGVVCRLCCRWLPNVYALKLHFSTFEIIDKLRLNTIGEVCPVLLSQMPDAFLLSMAFPNAADAYAELTKKKRTQFIRPLPLFGNSVRRFLDLSSITIPGPIDRKLRNYIILSRSSSTDRSFERRPAQLMRITTEHASYLHSAQSVRAVVLQNTATRNFPCFPGAMAQGPNCGSLAMSTAMLLHAIQSTPDCHLVVLGADGLGIGARLITFCQFLHRRAIPIYFRIEDDRIYGSKYRTLWNEVKTAKDRRVTRDGAVVFLRFSSREIAQGNNPKDHLLTAFAGLLESLQHVKDGQADFAHSRNRLRRGEGLDCDDDDEDERA
jgi:hypothetical protein